MTSLSLKEGTAAHLSVCAHRNLPRSVLVPLPFPSPHSLIPEQASLPLLALWLTRMAWGKAILELGERSCSWTHQAQNCTTKVSWNEALKCPTDLQPGNEPDDQPNHNRLYENSTLMLFFHVRRQILLQFSKWATPVKLLCISNSHLMSNGLKCHRKN